MHRHGISAYCTAGTSQYNGKSIADGFRRRCIAPGRLVGSPEKPSPGRRRRAAYIRYMTGLRMNEPRAQAACSSASRARISAFSLYRSSELALLPVMLKLGKRIRQLPARVKCGVIVTEGEIFIMSIDSGLGIGYTNIVPRRMRSSLCHIGCRVLSRNNSVFYIFIIIMHIRVLLTPQQRACAPSRYAQARQAHPAAPCAG